MPLPTGYCSDCDELPRSSTNNNGLKLFELCSGIRIVNGKVGSDRKVGQFRCASFQGQRLFMF